jgi:hypothetical protein
MNTEKKIRKLNLKRETLTALDSGRLATVRGGVGDDEGFGGGGGGAGPAHVYSNTSPVCQISGSLWACPQG